MFLRYLFIFILLLNLLVTLQARVIESDYYTSGHSEKDIKILLNVLNRRPKDLIALKRLARLYFILERYFKLKETTLLYLKISKNRDMAYMKIIAHASLGEYSAAIKNIDRFLSDYKITNKEKNLILEKRQLYSKSLPPNAFPAKGSRYLSSNDKYLIGINNREKYLIGKNKKTGKIFFYNYKEKKMLSVLKYPEYLFGLDVHNLIHISFAVDGRMVLASVKNGHRRSTVLLKQFYADEKKWSRWQLIKQINPGAWNCYAYFSSDLKAVFFVSDLNKESGLDLFYSKKDKEGNWQDPKKILNVNTSLDEYSLFLHADGETFIYSTNGKGGKGGFDLFYGKLIKVQDGYQVIKSKNIKECNTFRNEIYPLLIESDSRIAYFNFKFGNQIYLYKLSDSEIFPHLMVFLKGYVYDKISKNSISGAEVKIEKSVQPENRGTIKITTASDGYLGINLRRSTKYQVAINAKGYKFFQKDIVVSSKKGSHTLNFYLERDQIEEGYTFIARNIYFDYASALLKEESYPELKNIFEFLETYPNLSIEIAGHTDDVGSYKYNIELSKKRARAIADYLVGQGVSAKRLVVKGYGYTKRVTKDTSEKGRQKNRRVEIKVVKTK